MFATLLGGLPRPPIDASAGAAARLDAVIAAQADAGLGLLVDAGWGLIPEDPVASWRATAARTSLPVKAAVVGPYTTGLKRDASIDAQRGLIVDLASAGCPWVDILEPDAIGIGTADAARSTFLDLHHRLIDGLDGVHLSLVITGGSADAAGPETILGPPYASLAVDLIAGPDNWRLVTAAPPERGIVCGALSSQSGSDDGPEILLWAIAHASARRGSARVGLASASSLAGLPWAQAVTKLERLGAAARLAELPPGERRTRLDPRAVDIRTAALGHGAPRPAARDRRTRT